MKKIIYNSKKDEYKSHFGALPTNKECTFNIDILKTENPISATICVRKDGCSDFASYKMNMLCETNGYLRFSCSMTINSAGLYFYRFEFTCPNGTCFCGNIDGVATVGDWLPEWQLTVYDESFVTPDWAKNKVMYQIFPDRFNRSNKYMYLPSKNERKIINNWFSLPEPYGNDFYMGNLAGIIERLPYIKEMGVDIIYLNPIFESCDNHRYSTGDYLNVDSFLGTNDDFKCLCDTAQKYGIKIVLDGVFSHTGADSKYFNKYGHYDVLGAYQGEKSEYYNWYSFNDSKTGYECWWGFENLPNVNETHPAYMEFITGESGVLSYWQELGASGWRLDVADELPDEFLDALRFRVKKKDKNALIIGEVWEDATNKSAYNKRRRYLLGNQLDSVMNYPWRNAIINYIKTGDAESFSKEILKIEENYPKPSIDCLMNIVSTHDTERILNALGVLKDVNREEAKHYVLSKEEIERGVAGVKMAMFLLFSLPGIACVYYGDEVGLDGFLDPYSRKGYPYGKENLEIYEHIKEMSDLRKKYPKSFSSLIRDFYISGGAVCFRRGELLFAINMSEKEEIITISNEFVIICNKYSVVNMNKKLILPPKSCAVLLRKSR